MPIPIQELVEGFRSGNCVLFLGPDLTRDVDGESMQSGLLRHLKDQLGGKIEDDVDGLIKCDAKTKSRAYTHMHSFLAQRKEQTDLLRQIALLPFPLILSTTPDHLMEDALKQSGVQHEFQHYAMNEVPEALDRPSIEQPLAYNLFGCIKHEQSMILTHSDLLRFIFSVLGSFPLPQELTRTIQEARYFLFLGFDFDKWYLQLLFQLFLLKEGKISIAASWDGEDGGRGVNKDTWPDTVRPTNFYEDTYGVEQLDETIEEFVEALYNACEEQGGSGKETWYTLK